MKIPALQFGKIAENLATGHLQKKGFTIITRNYRYKKAEIDIIAQKEKLLVFVEVKCRSSTKFGYPEAFVNEKKQSLLTEAAENYIADYDWQHPIRFDIVAVAKVAKRWQIIHFEDAFY